MPQALVHRINAKLANAMESPDIGDLLNRLGATRERVGSPGEFLEDREPLRLPGSHDP